MWVPSRIPSPNEGTCFVTSAVALVFLAQHLKYNEGLPTQA